MSRTVYINSFKQAMDNQVKHKKIIVGRRVETTKKPTQKGIVIEQITGKPKLWKVQLDDGLEISCSSSQLRIDDYKKPVDLLNGVYCTTIPPTIQENPPVASLASLPVLQRTTATNGIGNVPVSRVPLVALTINTNTSANEGLGYLVPTSQDITHGLINPMESLHIAEDILDVLACANEGYDENDDCVAEEDGRNIYSAGDEDEMDEESELTEDMPAKDILVFEEAESGTRGTPAWDRYTEAKLKLIEEHRESTKRIFKSRPGSPGEGTKKYFWRAVNNSAGPEWKEYEDVQMRDFDFENFESYQFPYLSKLNQRIDSYNVSRLIETTKVTEKEWWIFHALILSPHQNGSNGMQIFSKDQHGLFPPPQYNRFMKESRFSEIRRHFHFAFHESIHTANEYQNIYNRKRDPWFPVNQLVDDFNENRKANVAASCKKAADKSMSACHPTTSPKGDLPHLSYIARKPEPFGTEFKNVACTVTGCLLHLEIQKGKFPLREAKHFKEYGCTSACSLRMMEATQHSGQLPENYQKELFLADSWFASVKTAECMMKAGNAFIGPVKTNTGGFPKAEIEAIMTEWPAGSSIVFEAEDEDGNKLGLMAVGYKYRKKSAITFVMTADAGSTTDGIT